MCIFWHDHRFECIILLVLLFIFLNSVTYLHVEIKEKHQVENTKNYVCFENLDCNMDISRTSESDRQNINI